MSDQDTNVANIQSYLLRFRELLNVIPEKGEPVNWEELYAQKEVASEALNQMMVIFSSQSTDVGLVGCKWFDPSVDGKR